MHAHAGELDVLEHFQALLFDAAHFSRVPRLDVPGWTVALPILAIPPTMTLAVRRQAPHQKREVPPGSRRIRTMGNRAVTGHAEPPNWFVSLLLGALAALPVAA
ncbi:MAG: hypothetical protein FJ280_00665 [Planctomycetes bacterium]|nr:hypothetical protein [Planctomycetota bacterium]